ncbi:hypothetical protein DFH09DRAFT_1301299 [Mycena vulgaris]|nr:hypothetical protein DFH09DRAFT_1301299 [Mycena vulgaris]
MSNRQVGASAAAYSLCPEIHRIINVATDTWLRCYEQEAPVFVLSTPEDPGEFAVWKVSNLQNGGVTISNIGLDSPVYARDDKIRAGYEIAPVRFAIEAAGDNTFVVKSVNEDLVWTLNTPEIFVKLRRASREDVQKWRFVPVGN